MVATQVGSQAAVRLRLSPAGVDEGGARTWMLAGAGRRDGGMRNVMARGDVEAREGSSKAVLQARRAASLGEVVDSPVGSRRERRVGMVEPLLFVVVLTRTASQASALE